MPPHAVSYNTVPSVGVIVLPQLSVTVGGVGAVNALLAHATFDPPSDGIVKVGAAIVYVYVHTCAAPLHP